MLFSDIQTNISEECATRW